MIWKIFSEIWRLDWLTIKSENVYLLYCVNTRVETLQQQKAMKRHLDKTDLRCEDCTEVQATHYLCTLNYYVQRLHMPVALCTYRKISSYMASFQRYFYSTFSHTKKYSTLVPIIEKWTRRRLLYFPFFNNHYIWRFINLEYSLSYSTHKMDQVSYQKGDGKVTTLFCSFFSATEALIATMKT